MMKMEMYGEGLGLYVEMHLCIRNRITLELNSNVQQLVLEGQRKRAVRVPSIQPKE